MAKARILVVDDEAVVTTSCSRILGEEGYLVETTESPRDGLARAERGAYDLVIVDLKMPEVGGMEFLQRLKETSPQTDVIMITGYAQIETAVLAMRLGACDYVPKPFSPDQLLVAVSKAVERHDLVSENLYLRQELRSKYRFENILAASPRMQEVFHLMARVAPTPSTVLVRGESGTGKELVARAIHFNSQRKDRVFMPVDCGALSETLLESELFGHTKGAFTGAVADKKGLFEIARGGTLFLDEIGSISLKVQSSLLRVLQEREFRPVGGDHVIKADVRLIAATNKDLEKMVREETFREDLFHRLNIFPIVLPPLRERREDIPPLAAHFLAKFAAETGRDVRHISPEALSLLSRYDWPGNVRELENAIQRAVVLANGPVLLPEHLTAGVQAGGPALTIPVPRTAEELKERKAELREKAVEEIERLFVVEALRRADGNVTRASADVGMLRPNFQALMRRHAIRSHAAEAEPGALLDAPPA